MDGNGDGPDVPHCYWDLTIKSVETGRASVTCILIWNAAKHSGQSKTVLNSMSVCERRRVLTEVPNAAVQVEVS